MAAASLFSVGKTVLAKLGPLVQQEATLVWNLRSELKKLDGPVTSIHALLLDAEEQQEHSHQVKNWLQKLEVLLFDAEDLLDDVAVEALREEAAAKDRIQCWTPVCFLFSLPNRLIYGLKMAHKVKSLREQLDAIHADNTKLHLTPRFEEKGKMRKHSPTISSIPDIVVGREDDLNHIKQLLLLANGGGSNVSVVSIVGIGGMGKTTVAQLIFNDREIKEQFELRLWVCVSDSFEVKVIVQKVLESATGGTQQNLELETLANHLKGHISERKYFLVLDDVWNFSPEKWDKLRSLLKSGASGSKILVTTRFENSARMMSRGSPDPPYVLSGLSSPQSWSLLRQVVSCSDDEPQDITNVEEIKTEIMKKSAGVPLAVKTVANLLYFKDPQTEWLSFLRSNEILGGEHEDSIIHNLKLSYDYLPSRLKHCFLLCSLFPKDHEISVDMLIYKWVALGLIESSPKDSKQSLFDLGLQTFMDLTWRSFFQEIKRDWANNMSTCKMHDLIHDLAVLVAGSSCKNISGRTIDGINEKTYHVLLSDVLCPSKIVGQLDKAKRLQTCFLQYEQWCLSVTSWDESTFKAFVSKFGSLRALDLINSESGVGSSHMQKLKHLRYLNMSYNDKMTRLPKFITTLQNLQVLFLYGCKSLQELPNDISKLVNLWILNCRKCYALTHMPIGLGELTRLETLTWFVVGKDSSGSKHIGGLNELNKLNKLRGFFQLVNLGHLRSTTILSPPPSLAFEIGAEANLKGKVHLEELALHWDDGDLEKEIDEWEEFLKKSREDDVEWDENLLEGLQPHSNLKTFSVVGYKGERSPSWISSLTNLITITLSWCNVHYSLHHLQRLPILQELHLMALVELVYVDEDEHEEKAASKPFFPSLQKLKLVGCPKLKGWQKRKQPTQFPKLSKLVIVACPLLTSMPLFPTLDKKLQLVETSLEPLLCTLNMSSVGHDCIPSSSASSSKVMQRYPLSKLKKLNIRYIVDPPKEWLQGMQHLTSLQEIEIVECSGMQDTLDWHNISHVPSIILHGYYINRDGQFLWDVYGWNNFHLILQDIYEAGAEKVKEEEEQVVVLVGEEAERESIQADC